MAGGKRSHAEMPLAGSAKKRRKPAEKPAAFWEAVAAFRAEHERRTERVNGKMKRSTAAELKARRAQFKDPQSVKPGATWYDKHVYYKTTINTGTEWLTLISYTDAEKQKALRLYWAVVNANPTSVSNKQKRKAELLEANAPKRAKAVEKYGDTSALERELLNADVDAINKISAVLALVLMLQTLADALFRTASMPAHKYKRWQHKTCRRIKVKKGGTRRYKFGDVMGYAQCLVVLECKADGAMFCAYGDDIDKKHKSKTLEITISKNDVKKSGRVKNEPYLKNKPWLEYLGKGPEARVNLAKRLEEECKSDRLPLCSIREANSELNGKHATEENGIKLWMQAKRGGIAADDDSRWDELPAFMRNKRHIYMLTHQGDVIAYPEHSAQGKTDIYIYTRKSNYTRHRTVQFKTASVMKGQNGFRVHMRTNSGTIDGVQQKSNTYKKGDNNLYIIVRPPTKNLKLFHWWTFTEAEMLKHKYIGEGCSQGFMVYRKDKPCDGEYVHAWTDRKHRSKRVT